MWSRFSKTLYILAALPLLYAYSHIAETRYWYRDAVNETSGTAISCEACHRASEGGGALNWDGMNFRDSGHEPRYFLSKSDQ
jgi:hypothetical protein